MSATFTTPSAPPAAAPNPLLTAALAYADLGYRVFPVKAGANKPPLTPHGFHDASTDPARIEAWWREHANANIGIATAGMVVIDRDPLDGKPNPWLEDDADKLMELATAPTAVTPRGGYHHFFRQPAGKHYPSRAGALALKVDARA